MAERLWVRLRVKDLYSCPKEELDYIHISRINFHIVILSLDLIQTTSPGNQSSCHICYFLSPLLVETNTTFSCTSKIGTLQETNPIWLENPVFNLLS